MGQNSFLQILEFGRCMSEMLQFYGFSGFLVEIKPCPPFYKEVCVCMCVCVFVYVCVCVGGLVPTMNSRTRKHLFQSLNFIKKRLPVNFAKYLRTPFL